MKRETRTWNRLGAENPMTVVLTYSDEWDPDDFFATGEAEIGEVVDYIESLKPGFGRGAALDFGCGLGRLTRALASRFDSVVGVDIAQSMVDQATELNAEFGNASFRVNTEPDLALFGDGSFDLVYSNIVLQHIPPAISRTYIEEFARVLRPGGIALFQIPDSPVTAPRRSPLRPLRRLMRGARSRFKPTMDMHCTPRASVEELLGTLDVRLLDVSPDDRAGREFVSFRYAFERNG